MTPYAAEDVERKLLVPNAAGLKAGEAESPDRKGRKDKHAVSLKTPIAIKALVDVNFNRTEIKENTRGSLTKQTETAEKTVCL